MNISISSKTKFGLYVTVWCITVNSEISVRILFSQIELKSIFVMLKISDWTGPQKRVFN